MREIILTQGMVALVDDEDFETINRFKWYVSRERRASYAARNHNGKTIRMHRVILNAPKGIHVDHVNGNGLDNRRENIRLCTMSENLRNQIKPHKDNKLGIKGVHWNKRDKKFQAQIRVDSKSIKLGHFNVMGDADSAYRFAEEKYFREFARAK